jgi:phycoerythrin-associated linker protein
MTEPTTLSSAANVDTSHAADVIHQTYRQVFGNRHLMELDVNPSIEALFINGDLTVQGLVTALAQSETYKKLFLENNSPYRFVELNFKHLLGRPPRDQAELMGHVRLLQEEGYEAEIASYTYSDEYLSAFGIDQVPYNRATQTVVGGSTLYFTRAKALDAGFAGYDNAETDSKLLNSLCTDSSPEAQDRRGVGNANSLTINWTSRRQVGANRRAVQKSVVTQTSMSATIKSILSQGGQILSIAKANSF